MRERPWEQKQHQLRLLWDSNWPETCGLPRLGRARKKEARLALTRPRGRAKRRPSRGSLKPLLIGEDLGSLAIWSTPTCNSQDSTQPVILPVGLWNQIYELNYIWNLNFKVGVLKKKRVIKYCFRNGSKCDGTKSAFGGQQFLQVWHFLHLYHLNDDWNNGVLSLWWWRLLGGEMESKKSKFKMMDGKWWPMRIKVGS